jgi:hypothetical protein
MSRPGAGPAPGRDLTSTTKGAMMPTDDLSGISGLDDRHRTVLDQKAGITSYYELIMADRQRIVDAFGRRTYRPTTEQVAEWQDEARRLRAAAIDASLSPTESPEWEPVAMFVVAFEERRQGEASERRIVAEQTEIESGVSPQPKAHWPGWACDDACQWMLEYVEASDKSTPPDDAQTTSVTEAAASASAESRSKIDIERAILADAIGDTELVEGSRPLPQGRRTWTQPARLLVTLGVPPSGSGTSVVLQLVRNGGHKLSIAGQFDAAGRVAEIALGGLPTAEYKPAVVAWTPDGSSLPCVVKLPAVDVVAPATGPGAQP